MKGGEKAVQGRTGLVMAEQRKSKHRVQSGDRKGRWGQLIGGGERRQGKVKNDAAEQGLRQCRICAPVFFGNSGWMA